MDHKQLLLPLREAFEDLFSQTYSRKQNLTFLGHVQTCFRGKRWQDLLKLMDHVCKSALTKGLQEKCNGIPEDSQNATSVAAEQTLSFSSALAFSCFPAGTVGGALFQT